MLEIWTEYLLPAWAWACTYLFPILDYLIQLLLPAVLVFIVARYAQNTFHKNARTRENRERKLKRVEELISNICEANIHIRRFLYENLPSAENAVDRLSSSIINLHTYSGVYDLNISDEVTKLSDALESIAESYFEKSTIMLNNNTVSQSKAEAKSLIPGAHDIVQIFKDMPVDKYLNGARNEILWKLTAIHKEIEAQQLK